jgi:hypothetical protein
VILRNLSGKILLALEQGGDVALEFDEFPGDGFGGAGADQASGECAGQDGGAEDGTLRIRMNNPPQGSEALHQVTGSRRVARKIIPAREISFHSN